MATPEYECLYCGNPTKRPRKGEHIVPKAIGGNRYILNESDRVVCTQCNNGVLSQLDRELCGRSSLAVIASQELSADLWQVWDVDNSAQNLLIEAQPVWVKRELLHLVTYPQLIVESEQTDIRGDSLQFSQFGLEASRIVLLKAAKSAFQRYAHGVNRALHFERIRPNAIRCGYRYPPRVYSKHCIGTIAKKIGEASFIVRYSCKEDRRRALRALDRIDPAKRPAKWGETRGTHTAQMAHSYDMSMVVRALMKLGVNLLASYCTKTIVQRSTFEKVVRVICGERQLKPSLLATNGFVHSAGLAPLQAESSVHSFRLVHMDNNWLVYSSFFGGRIGAVVRFPGPNNEDWNTLSVVAPLDSTPWRVEKSKFYLPLQVQVDWKMSMLVVTTLSTKWSRSGFTLDEVPQLQAPQTV